jgi:hypothetical protein
VIGARIIDATARPQSFAAPYADIELEGYLTVWKEMHPEFSIERLTPMAHPKAALGALGDEGDLLGTPAGDLGRAQPSHGGEVEASCPG